jgi:peptidoglycan/xylan/chitin deacetylase (PgdA/CDA1 family)
MTYPTIVTTSWDDGDPNDLRVAELLHSRGLKGTFYVPIKGYHGGQTLKGGELRSLTSGGFEIGAHGVSHRVLTELNSDELVQEVRICKRELEDILSEPVRMFCYPKGRYNAKVMRDVKDAGYQGARTTRMLTQRLVFNPFRMPTSLLVHSNIRKLSAKNLVRNRNFRGMLDYITRFIYQDSWVSVGKVLFDHVMRKGGVWHLYGHSWEIEQGNLWAGLAELLDYVCRREGVLYSSNCDVLKYLPKESLQSSAVAKDYQDESSARP